jgi:hypothetical protein
MKAFRTVVVAVILGAMFSPSISLAKSEPAAQPVPARQIVQTGVVLANAVESTAKAVNAQQSSESSQYAQREQQSKDLQDFKGGAVYLYFDVPDQLHVGLMTAESHGGFYASFIRNAGFDFEQVD